MKYLKLFDKFNIKNFFKVNETIVYHGNKAGNLAPDIDEIDNKPFYLTTNKEYALSYASNIKDNVFIYDIDFSKLLDLRNLGIRKYKYSEFSLNFKKITGEFPPLGLQQHYSWTRRTDDMTLWEWLRYDSSGANLFKKKFTPKYSGFFFIEEKDRRSYESILLFNKTPINEFLGIVK